MLSGPPPLLTDYYDALAAAEMHLRGASKVFAAVGVAISAEEREMLDSNRTSWGAPVVRSTTGKAYHRGRRNSSAPSYVVAALVDLTVCRDALWLAGWSGSTYALAVAPLTRARPLIYHASTPGRFLRILARFRKLDYGRGWWSVCPSFVEKRTGCKKHRVPTGDAVRLLDGEDAVAQWRICNPNCSKTACHGRYVSLAEKRRNGTATRRAGNGVQCERGAASGQDRSKYGCRTRSTE